MELKRAEYHQKRELHDRKSHEFTGVVTELTNAINRRRSGSGSPSGGPAPAA